ncbi:MAG: hypothetical protein MKZ95_17280 [Pirellulales bacterium]|nr:hypothetical protein [Pirellulales bacterium]
MGFEIFAPCLPKTVLYQAELLPGGDDRLISEQASDGNAERALVPPQASAIWLFNETGTRGQS